MRRVRRHLVYCWSAASCSRAGRKWIQGRWVEKAGQRRRRYYRITPEAVAAQRKEWGQISVLSSFANSPESSMRDRELREWRELIRERADRQWRELSPDVVEGLAGHLTELPAAARISSPRLRGHPRSGGGSDRSEQRCRRDGSFTATQLHRCASVSISASISALVRSQPRSDNRASVSCGARRNCWRSSSSVTSLPMTS
jgi:Predicted transcriptional regulators